MDDCVCGGCDKSCYSASESLGYKLTRTHTRPKSFTTFGSGAGAGTGAGIGAALTRSSASVAVSTSLWNE
jgi:hypothetical protein